MRRLKSDESDISQLVSIVSELHEKVDSLTSQLNTLPSSSLNRLESGAPIPWIEKASEYIGIDEEDDEDVVIELSQQAGTPIESSEIPWCAIFVNAILASCGLATTGTMRARDFENWGQDYEDAEGAVVVYRSHVGFVPEPGKVLGGNQSDGVTIGEQRWFGKPIAFRWPAEYEI